MSILHILQKHAEKNPQKIALVYYNPRTNEQEELSYLGLYEKSNHLANYLKKYTQKGERAMLLYLSGLDYIIAFFACMFAEIIPVPAYPPKLNRNSERLKNIFENCKPSLILSSNKTHSYQEKFLEELKSQSNYVWIKTDDLLQESFKKGGCLTPVIDEQNIAFLQYSSGSTNQPKGIKVSHSNLLNNFKLMVHSFNTSENSVFITWLPLSHDMGLILILLQCIYVGGKCIISNPFSFSEDPLSWIETISKFSGTITAAPNFAYDLCLQKLNLHKNKHFNLSSLEVSINASDHIYENTTENFYQTFKKFGLQSKSLFFCYGLAENTVLASSKKGVFTTDFKNRTLVACGDLTKEQDIRFLVCDSKQQIVDDGVEGEIFIHSKSVAKGYWGEEKQTDKIFNNQLLGSSNSWLSTGDLGIIKDKHLFITGRIRDKFNIQGVTYYANEIEKVASESHSILMLHGSAFFPILEKNQETCILIQEVKFGYQKLDLENLCNTIINNVFKKLNICIDKVLIVPKNYVSKTTSGKIRRFYCREQFLNDKIKPLYMYNIPIKNNIAMKSNNYPNKIYVYEKCDN